MVETIIFEASFAVVKYLHELKLVQIIWNGSVSKEQYQETFIQALDFQEKSGFPVYSFMSDSRNQSVVSPESRKWMESYAVPRSIKQGLRRSVVVFDGNIFKKYYLNIILQATNKFRLPFKFFGTFEEAVAWIKSFNDLP